MILPRPARTASERPHRAAHRRRRKPGAVRQRSSAVVCGPVTRRYHRLAPLVPL